MELTIDDVKGIVGTLVIEGIVKDKRIKQLEDEIAQLKNGTGADDAAKVHKLRSVNEAP